jgi:hypothetical protein
MKPDKTGKYGLQMKPIGIPSTGCDIGVAESEEEALLELERRRQVKLNVFSREGKYEEWRRKKIAAVSLPRFSWDKEKDNGRS